MEVDVNCTEQVSLPTKLESLIEQICNEQKKPPLNSVVRRKLAAIGEKQALDILNSIKEREIQKSFGGFVLYMIKELSSLSSPSPTQYASTLSATNDTEDSDVTLSEAPAEWNKKQQVPTLGWRPRNGPDWFVLCMASENVYLIIYPNGEISHTTEEITFVCDDPLWIMIPPQTSLQDLKNLILVHTEMVGKKEITKLTYRMPVAVANLFAYQKMQIKSDQQVSMMFSYHRSIGTIYSLELCMNIQNIGGSSSSSNNVEGVRNMGAVDFAPGPDISRDRSPSFNAFVVREQNANLREPCPSPSTLLGFDRHPDVGIAETSDEDDIEEFSGNEAEAIPET
ncbi:hypothetical protein Ahy_A05g023252 [Arachis hypogaea]|uniref:RDRP3-5 N-terminal domain-containing protein n=1 Tax=Arachis hypogaea TaxID=3818 RepID=A0A445D2T8_ARAHY|nr:hypothetical protein Ahy_A05g023252 [Arachis hypogaea]